LKGIEVLAESDFKKIDNLKGTILALKKQIEPLKVEVQKQSDLAKQRKKEKHCLRRNFSNEYESIKLLNDKLLISEKTTTEENQKLQLQIESLTAEIQKQSGLANQKENENLRLQQDLSEKDEQIKLLQEKSLLSEQTATEGKKENQSQIRYLTFSMQKQSNLVIQRENENRQLQQRLSEKDAQINRLNEQLSLSGQATAEQGQKLQLQNEQFSLSGQATAEQGQKLQLQIESLTDEVQRQSNLVIQRENENHQLQQRLSEKDAQINRLNEQFSLSGQATSEQGQKLQLQIESLTAEVQRQSNLVIQRENENRQLQQRLSEKDAQINRLNEQLSLSGQWAKQTIQDLQNENRDLAAILEQKEMMYEGLQSKAEKFYREVTAEKQQLFDANTELMLNSEQKDARIEELFNQLRAKEENIQKIGQLLEKNQQETEQLKEEDQKNQSQIESLTVEVQRQSSLASQKEDENFRLQQDLSEKGAQINRLNGQLLLSEREQKQEIQSQIEFLTAEVQKQSNLAKQKEEDNHLLCSNLSKKDKRIELLNKELLLLRQATTEEKQKNRFHIEALEANTQTQIDIAKQKSEKNHLLQQDLTEKNEQIKLLREQLLLSKQATTEEKQKNQSQIETLEADANLKESKNLRLQEKIKSLTTNANQKENENRQLQQRLSEKDAQINLLREQLLLSEQAATEQKQKNQSQIETLEANANQKEVEQIKQDLQTEKDLNNKARLYCEEIESINVELRRNLEQKDAHIKELLDQLRNKEKNIKKIGQLLKISQQEYKKLEAERNEMYESAKSEIKRKKQSISKLQEKIEELSIQLMQTQQGSVEPQQQLTVNEHQLAEAQQKSAILHQQTQNPACCDQNSSVEAQQMKQLHESLSGPISYMRIDGTQIKFASLLNWPSLPSSEEMIKVLSSFMREVVLLDIAFCQNLGDFNKLSYGLFPIRVNEGSLNVQDFNKFLSGYTPSINAKGSNLSDVCGKIGTFLTYMLKEKKLFKERYDQIETEKIKHARSFIAMSRQCERRIALLKRYYAQ
jgi:chromosome segregation ATPase